MTENNHKGSNVILRILVLPLAVVMRLSPAMVLAAALACTLVGVGIYYSANSDFLGLAAPPLAELTYSPNYELVSDKQGRRWTIEYEADVARTFNGVVRHVSHWREEDIPFATHDILITTGDFASQERVHVSVMMHTFSYKYYEAPGPKGTINLLHIVPASEEIYRQLLKVRDWNQVSIRGREILRIERYDSQGTYLGYWQDAGCNSILVNSVEILAKGTPVP